MNAVYLYTWQEFQADIKNLVENIRQAAGSFDAIFAIPRGGLVPAVTLSHELDLPLILGGVTPRTLVVDDIADTGHTLSPYRKRGSTILTLFRHKNCPFTPHYFARENTTWVVFPWERRPEKMGEISQNTRLLRG